MAAVITKKELEETAKRRAEIKAGLRRPSDLETWDRADWRNRREPDRKPNGERREYGAEVRASRKEREAGTIFTDWEWTDTTGKNKVPRP